MKPVAPDSTSKPMYVANDSLSHTSFHQAIVTRSPNHMWAISCAMTIPRVCRSARVTVDGKRKSSRKVTQPGFSTAPASSSGTNAWS